jgi:hypothetical protein
MGLTAAAAPVIHVRVGTNDCGGFNGDWKLVTIGEVQGLPLFGYEFYGIEWNNCRYGPKPSTVYTFVKWTAVGITTNTQLQPTAGVGKNPGIDQTISVGLATAGNVHVTACLKWFNSASQEQWSCGKSQGPLQ